MQNYEVGNFQIMNVMPCDTHVDLYLRNLNDNTIKLESFSYENQATHFLYYVLGVLGIQSFTQKHEAMIGKKVQLLIRKIKNDYEIVGIVGKDMWIPIESKMTIDNIPFGMDYVVKPYASRR